jgi:hypothetical protein
MADIPAHDAEGPQSDPVDTTVPATAEAPESDDTADAVATVPIFAEQTGVRASDVEVVGRYAAAQAQLGEDAKVPVLVGAASVTSVKEHSAEGSGSERDLQPRSPSPAPDEPVWSFPDGARQSSSGSPSWVPVDRSQVELPFTPPAARTAPLIPSARPQPLFGPVGQPRSAIVVALLAVVTLGVSALVWHHRVNRELEEFDPQLHSRPMRSTVAVAVPWLIGLLTTVAGAVLIVADRLAIHVPLASHVTSTQAYYLLGGLVAVPYLTLLIPFSVVAVVMTLERLRCVEEHVGTTSDRQVRAVGSTLLLVIPVVGGLFLLGAAQRRLNAIWAALAPAGHLTP